MCGAMLKRLSGGAVGAAIKQPGVALVSPVGAMAIGKKNWKQKPIKSALMPTTKIG